MKTNDPARTDLLRYDANLLLLRARKLLETARDMTIHGVEYSKLKNWCVEIESLEKQIAPDDSKETSP